MTPVRFEIRTTFDAPPRRVWDELIDWKGHEAWVPATRVELAAVDGAAIDGAAVDATAVGGEFTAFTGYGPLTLEDRMRVVRCDWDEAAARGDCEVEKLGPRLRGRASFTVQPEGAGCVVTWTEDVTVPYVPRLAAPVVAKLGAVGFTIAMRRLAKLVRS